MNSLNLLLTIAGVLRQADAVLFVPRIVPLPKVWARSNGNRGSLPPPFSSFGLPVREES